MKLCSEFDYGKETVNYLLQKLVPLKKMMPRLELIRALLSDPDELEESDEELKIWVRQVKDVVHETEDLLGELELLQTQNHSDGFSISLRKICCFRHMKAQYPIASELKDMDC